MSVGINKVFLVGNLAADPEFRVSDTGKTKLSMRLACTERYFDKKTNAWKEKTEWVSVVVWGGRAVGLQKILAKGKAVAVSGGLRSYHTLDKGGNKRYFTEVVGDEIVVVTPKNYDGPMDVPEDPNPGGHNNFDEKKPDAGPPQNPDADDLF